MRLLHAVHILKQHAAELYAKGDPPLTLTQLIALEAIEAAPRLNQTRFVEATCIDRATMGSLLGRLEKEGLISRSRPKDDARAWEVVLTAEGRRQLIASRKSAAAAEQRLLALYPPAFHLPSLIERELASRATPASADAAASHPASAPAPERASKKERAA